MIYHFKEIESGQIVEGYTILDINDHQAEIANDNAPALLLAEKHGGELFTLQGKPPADPAKYKAEQVGGADALRLANEAAVQKLNQSTLTKDIEAGTLATDDAPAKTDPVARQQQATALRTPVEPKKPDEEL
jgi:hypothetical protein